MNPLFAISQAEIALNCAIRLYRLGICNILATSCLKLSCKCWPQGLLWWLANMQSNTLCDMLWPWIVTLRIIVDANLGLLLPPSSASCFVPSCSIRRSCTRFAGMLSTLQHTSFFKLTSIVTHMRKRRTLLNWMQPECQGWDANKAAEWGCGLFFKLPASRQAQRMKLACNFQHECPATAISAISAICNSKLSSKLLLIAQNKKENRHCCCLQLMSGDARNCTSPQGMQA